MMTHESLRYRLLKGKEREREVAPFAKRKRKGGGCQHSYSHWNFFLKLDARPASLDKQFDVIRTGGSDSVQMSSELTSRRFILKRS